MFFYIVLFTCVMIFSFCYSFAKQRDVVFLSKNLCFFFLFFPAAFRYGIGTDYNNYVSVFYKIGIGQKPGIEYGWFLLNKVISYFHFPVQLLFIFASFITYLLLFKTKRRDSFVILVIYFCYLYTTSYNLVRNAISISLAWYGYICLIDNKKMKGFFIICLGAFFHYSALLYIPFYLISCLININRKKTLLIIIISFLIIDIINLQDIFLKFSFIKNFRWTAYFTSKKYSSITRANTGIGIAIRHFFMLYMYLLCSPKNCSKSEFSSMSWLFVFLWVSDLLSSKIVIFYRLNICFYISYLSMFKLLNYHSNNVYINLGKVLCYIYVLFFVFILNLVLNTNAVIPYKSVFF